MSATSKIEWTDASWNPVSGCTPVTAGCDHCYAKTFAERWRGIPGHPYQQGFDLTLHEDRLLLPFAWEKPKRIFVNSMSDLFHSDIPLSFIQRVFATMEKAHWHTFQILTKRGARLARLAPELPWPANVWIGVSIENEKVVGRANQLRQVKGATVRFISAEPLLGPLDALDLTGIDWLIAGGESGVGHRPMELNWVRRLRDRCQERGIAFFYKQQGGLRPGEDRMLDGREWNEFPHSTEKVM